MGPPNFVAAYTPPLEITVLARMAGGLESRGFRMNWERSGKEVPLE
jgi:hypothetical protein